jgi:phage tail-like protein
MDANRQRLFLFARDQDWERPAPPGAPAPVSYDRTRKVLRLASSRRNPGWGESPVAANTALGSVPGSVDTYGTRAFWKAPQVRATGAFPDSVPIYEATTGSVEDVAIGHDDVLYLAALGQVVLRDLRGRWEPASVTLSTGGASPPFAAWRVAPLPGGGAYALDRSAHRIGRVTGLPMRGRTGFAYAPGTFRPVAEDADPPRGWWLEQASWPAGEKEVAIAASPEGRLALLTWLPGADARLRLLGDDDRFGPPTTLRGVRFPYSLAWVGSDRVAVLIVRSDTGTQEAAVYPISWPADGSEVVDPVGDLYPLREHALGTPFLHSIDQPPSYLTAKPVGGGELIEGVRQLHKISWPSYAARGSATNARPVDSGNPQTVWHRVYLEGVIPPGCGVRVWLAATAEAEAPPAGPLWHEHRFGSSGEPDESLSEAERAAAAALDPDVPRGVWLPQASEVPFHPGLLSCERRPHQAGLFTALVQRAGHRVRTLSGRYLWVRAELIGDGRSSPEIAAVRVYGDRQSYVGSYLPELYREQLFGPEADERSTPDRRVASTRADFLERFVGNFEGILTPIEDRIKHAWLVTDPSATPDESIEWLAGWIGASFAAALPVERRRAMLAATMELYQRRGTLRGLALALDLATGGAVERGEVVVFEDFRLRRTFATILGANLAAVENPLLPGLVTSGNSFVGDTLFLGDEHHREFLALFDADLVDADREPDSAAAIASLFDRLAHRATVLVHSEIAPQDLGLIRQIVDRETPAHVAVQVLTASQRFLVGMSSLVGIDTFLGRKPGPTPVQVDVSTVGLRDVVQRVPSLDPRLGESPSQMTDT